MGRLVWENGQAGVGRGTQTVSLDKLLRRERGQGNIHFLCSPNHKQG